MEKLISIGQAAKISGRTPKTVRRWITSGMLEDKRKKKDRGSPILINEQELKLLLLESVPQEPEGQRKDTESPLIGALNGQIRDLREQVSHLKELLAQSQREREAMQETVEEARRVREALERELIGRQGIRGLIKEGLRIIRR